MRRLSLALVALLLALGCATSQLAAQTEGKKSDAKQKTQKKAAPGKSTTTAAPSGELDLNTATREELMQLDGIGPAYADRIIKARPYTRKDQLVQKKIVPQATYEKVKDKIVAKRPAGAKPAAAGK